MCQVGLGFLLLNDAAGRWDIYDRVCWCASFLGFIDFESMVYIRGWEFYEVICWNLIIIGLWMSEVDVVSTELCCMYE